MKNIKNNKSSYGALTDASKELNKILGDTSGRTVSRRTAHGLKNFFNAKSMDDDAAELIVHGGMVAASRLLKSTKESEKSNGILLSFALLICYQAGK